MSILEKLAEEGFDSDAVVASVNTIEFSLRENNPHQVTIEMKPNPEKASQDEAVEKEILEKVKASMTEEDLTELAHATKDLHLKQETPDPPEALKTVPSLSLNDIPKKPISIPTVVGEINGVTVLRYDLFANDVLYAEVVLNMRSLEQGLLPLVLFCHQLNVWYFRQDVHLIDQQRSKQICFSKQNENGDLEYKVDQEWDSLSSLEQIRRSLLSKNGCLINLTADEKNLCIAEKYVSKFLDALPNSSCNEVTWNARLPPINEAIVIPTQVNYVGKAANIYDTGYQLSRSARVISKYIGNMWLWDRVRVSGGAYGGFCDFDTHSVVFSYLSYHDPNLLKTLEVYDETANFLCKLQLDDDTLTKAIIGTIGDVDSYQLPDAKGYSSTLHYLLVITEERQKRREEILSMSLMDFNEFADLIESVKHKVVAVAVASGEDVAALEEPPGFFHVELVV